MKRRVAFPLVTFQELNPKKIVVRIGKDLEGYLVSDVEDSNPFKPPVTVWYWEPESKSGRNFHLENSGYYDVEKLKTVVREFLEKQMKVPEGYETPFNRKADYAPQYTVTVKYTQWSKGMYSIEQEGQKDRQTFSSFPAAVDFAIQSMPLVTEPNIGYSRPYETQVVDDSLMVWDASSGKNFTTQAFFRRSDGEFLSEEELAYLNDAVYDAARESKVRTNKMPVEDWKSKPWPPKEGKRTAMDQNQRNLKYVADIIADELNNYGFRGVSHLTGPQPVKAYFDGPQYGTYRVDFAWDDNLDPVDALKDIFSSLGGVVKEYYGGDLLTLVSSDNVFVWAENALSHEKYKPWSTSRIPGHGSWHVSIMNHERGKSLFPRAFDTVARVKKATRDSLEYFKQFLSGVVVVTGEGYLDPDNETVNVAIVHDGSGFNPGAAIVVDSYASGEGCLQEAFERLELYNYENHRDYYDELVGEYGEERGGEVFTESFDGNAWDNLPSWGVAELINQDKFASKHIDIDPEFGLKPKPLYKLPPTTGKTRKADSENYDFTALGQKVLDHYHKEYKKGWRWFLEALDDVIYGEVFNKRLPRGFDMVIGVDLKRPDDRFHSFIWNVKPLVISPYNKSEEKKWEDAVILGAELKKLVEQFEEGRFASTKSRKSRLSRYEAKPPKHLTIPGVGKFIRRRKKN